MRKQIDILDSPHANIKKHFTDGILFIHEARVSGKAVYVHCAAGG